jgi:hypothetical protein
MIQQLPILPVGWQLFEEIRKKNAVYIDKTMYLPMLRNSGKFVFCARPRRFGKTLTVHALDSFHSGRLDLFRGLAAEAHMSSPDFTARPVIRLDMNRVAGSGNIPILEMKIKDVLGDIAKRHGVTLNWNDSAGAFFSILRDVHEVTNKKVVLLIDEYDAPIIKLIEREKPAYDELLLAKTRIVIREFYSQIKSAEEHIEFAFITGVTKFSRMGMFSQLNNLIDISSNPEFASFMGYTQNELEDNFAPFILNIVGKRGNKEKDLLDAIRDYYDGFSFDGKTMLYCPFSILSFFADAQSFIADGQFVNYWMESGSNTLVRKFLKDKALTVDQFQDLRVDRNFIRNPGEIDITSPAGFLYQAGYLTIRLERGEAEESGDPYVLCYPNREVRSAVSTLFLENLALASSWVGISAAGKELHICLATVDVPGMVTVLRRLFAGICYDDHSMVNREPDRGILADIIRKVGVILSFGKRRRLNESLAELFRRKMGEGFYRSVLHASLSMAGAKVTPEMHVGHGRIDLLAECGDLTYVIELKMAKDARRGTEGTLEGISQIRNRGYARGFKHPVPVSIAIGRKERNIVAYRFEWNGKEIAGEI